LKEKFKVSPTCGWTHDAPVQVGVSAGGGGAHTAHGGRLGVAGAADDIQASGGLDPPEGTDVHCRDQCNCNKY